jgi:CheY-like chemotaxis protein
MTSFAVKGDREQYLQMGFTEYIIKPINKDLLIKRIREILQV